MSAAGLSLLAIGLWTARKKFARARGIDKVVALTHLCYGMPFAVFGAEHLSREGLLLSMVPPYMPWRLFWLYFVGVALIAASLSIVTQFQVRWSGLLLGITMFLFVVMLYIPGAVTVGGRIAWTVVFRELSFGGAGCVLAGTAMSGKGGGQAQILLTVGRVLIAITAIFFGVQHFLHPLGLPGVPLLKQMPPWVPACTLIDYLTGAFLLVAGFCFLWGRKTRLAATYLGAWILLLLLVIYGPVMITALADPDPARKIEGISYFADTLLFGGVILSLACAVPIPWTENRFVTRTGPAQKEPVL